VLGGEVVQHLDALVVGQHGAEERQRQAQRSWREGRAMHDQDSTM
jgi:hypothetical protein